MNILLPFPDNFKKSAKYLTDDQLKDQIIDIDLLYYAALTENDSGKEPLKNEVIDWYKYQLRWLCKYQLALMSEYKIRFGTNHIGYKFYKGRYFRIKSPNGLGSLYRNVKWDPAAFENERRQLRPKKEIASFYQNICKETQSK